MKTVCTTFILLVLLSSTNLINAQDTLWQEGFESGSFPPLGWDIKRSSTLYGTQLTPPSSPIYEKWVAYSVWNPSTMWARTDTDAACISPSAPDYSWLITNDIAINTNTIDTLEFWLWYKSATPSYFTKLIIMVNPAGQGWEKLDSIYEQSSYSNYYNTPYKFDLSTYAGSSIKLGFVFQGFPMAGSYQLTMDDIHIAEWQTTDIKENSSISNLCVYPCPATTQSNISFYSKENTNTTIRIFDYSGQMVMNMGMVDCQQGRNVIDVDTRNLAKGMYFIHINQSENQATEKLIIF